MPRMPKVKKEITKEQDALFELVKMLPSFSVDTRKWVISFFLTDKNKADEINILGDSGREVLWVVFPHKKETAFSTKGKTSTEIAETIKKIIARDIKTKVEEINDAASRFYQVFENPSSINEAEHFISCIGRKDFKTLKDFVYFVGSLGDSVGNYEIATIIYDNIKSNYTPTRDKYRILLEFASTKSINEDVRRNALIFLFEEKNRINNSAYLYNVLSISKSLKVDINDFKNDLYISRYNILKKYRGLRELDLLFITSDDWRDVDFKKVVPDLKKVNTLALPNTLNEAIRSLIKDLEIKKIETTQSNIDSNDFKLLLQENNSIQSVVAKWSL